ncbi:hypothetical protein AGMMS50256_34360 [Betaproteobacteria bacterium]|nr:hypothetical protein AGMMS50256_34360 [Betaproteobacteria bacterium]
MILAIFGIFGVMTLLGAPIAIALLGGALGPMLIYGNIPPTVIAQRFYNSINMYALMAIPFFVISGGLLDKGGVSSRLVNLANSLVGWLPGGLAVVSFFACAFFGSISGVSSATVVAIGSIMVPAMIRAGYPKNFALTTVASGGWLGIVIPPSTPMVIYGISTGTSIGDMFIGGIIPGFALAMGMSIYGIAFGFRHLPKPKPFSIREVFISFKEALLALVMPLIVLGGIYAGVFTPTEAAAIAVLYGFIVGIFIYKELDAKTIYSVFRSAVITSAVVMFIVGGASVFGYLMTRAQIPGQIAAFVLDIANTPQMFMAMTVLLFLIVGTFMETTPAILILAPILSPLLPKYGISPVFFGVIFVITMGIGMLTPPVGMNLYVAAGLMNEKVDIIINRHLWAYILCAVLVLAVLIVFPEIVLLLPNMMK